MHIIGRDLCRVPTQDHNRTCISYTNGTGQATESQFSLPRANTNFIKQTGNKPWNSLPLLSTKLTHIK